MIITISDLWNSTTDLKLTKKIMEVTGKKGKDVYLPLRLALTSMPSGPEMSIILTLLSKEEIIKRISSDA